MVKVQLTVIQRLCHSTLSKPVCLFHIDKPLVDVMPCRARARSGILVPGVATTAATANG
jgi:hypothetical protein